MTTPVLTPIQVLTAAAAILLTASILYVTAPIAGDFQYSDAPRHALNGAFFLDLLRSHPIADPVGWAAAYYLQYPALTILFYPPLFHFVEAGMFAMFGVSHATAQLTVTFFSLFGAGAAYLIARRIVSPSTAIAAAILFLAMPAMAFWGRQVMLDVPAVSVTLCAVVCFLRFVESGKTAWLIAGTVVFGLALYIKQPMAFMGLPLAWLLFRAGRLFRRATLIAGAIFLIEIIPLAIITVKFGGFNAVSVTETPGAGHGPAALFYLRALPGQLGWLLAAVAVIAIPAAMLLKKARPPQPLGGFLVAWFVTGLVFFTLIGLKSDRLDLPALFPVVLMTLWALERILPARDAAWSVGGLAVGTAAYALLLAPVPAVGGYEDAVSMVVQDAPADSAVLFSGKRDGAFIFDMRARAPARQDISIIRADKLFFEMAVSSRYGVKTLRDLDEPEILGMLNALGVKMAVIQPGFMTDQPVMQRLQHVLDSPAFAKMKTIPVRASVFGAEDKEIVIYRNISTGDFAGAGDYEISLPIIDRRITLRKR
jgi:hypothetical protein